jgi:hypothetical protein
MACESDSTNANKVICWDVGIKNLAFCLMEATNQIEYPYIIHKWEIINVIKDDDAACHVVDCIHQHDVKYCCSHMGDIVCFCKQHKKTHTDWLQRWETAKNTLRKIDTISSEASDVNNASTTCAQISLCCMSCAEKGKWCLYDEPSGRTIAFCGKHKSSLLKKWDKEISLRSFQSAKVKSIPTEQLKLTLFQRLDAIPELLDVHVVCIENQPSFKNPRMKAVADSIYSWYLIRGKIDRLRNHLTPIHKVLFVSPSNKLKIKGCEETINEEIANSSNKYKTVKNLSVKYCKDILNYEPEYIRHIEAYKKQDDIADVFLFGVYYFTNMRKKEGEDFLDSS